MLKESVAQLLEEQINKEFFSAYLYLEMSNYYYGNSLDGFGNWFKVQAQEEQDHAMLFLTYLQTGYDSGTWSNLWQFWGTLGGSFGA